MKFNEIINESYFELTSNVYIDLDAPFFMYLIDLLRNNFLSEVQTELEINNQNMRDSFIKYLSDFDVEFIYQHNGFFFLVHENYLMFTDMFLSEDGFIFDSIDEELSFI